eukprot:364250-Chlamydomonas_euryale.AAC.9
MGRNETRATAAARGCGACPQAWTPLQCNLPPSRYNPTWQPSTYLSRPFPAQASLTATPAAAGGHRRRRRRRLCSGARRRSALVATAWALSERSARGASSPARSQSPPALQPSRASETRPTRLQFWGRLSRLRGLECAARRRAPAHLRGKKRHPIIQSRQRALHHGPERRARGTKPRSHARGRGWVARHVGVPAVDRGEWPSLPGCLRTSAQRPALAADDARPPPQAAVVRTRPKARSAATGQHPAWGVSGNLCRRLCRPR